MNLVEVRQVSKRFPGVVALQDVSVAFEAGAVHALLGENGAGKSTLGKLLAGLYQPDSGEIVFEGKQVHFGSPGDAVSCGISMIHQELLFAENLTVAENLCLSDLPRKGPFVNRREMVRKANEWLRAIGAEIDPNATLGELSISKQQLVQIAGGIGKGARVLIFDEPTSSLSQAEAARLLSLIKQLKQRGMACIYVSHRLEEVFEISDTITVLRDGQLVQTVSAHAVDRPRVVRLMIGRELAASLSEHSHPAPGDTILKLEGVSSPGKLREVSLELRRGEILGLAGLVGAGRTELAEALFGLDARATGTILVHGKPLTKATPRQAMNRRMGLVPEDRKRHGLVLSMNAGQNVSLPTLDALATAGWVRRRAEKSLVGGYFESMKVKAPSQDAATTGLSGGNQQKLVLAKWLAADSDVLIVDEPTRGVDVGAKAEIHNLIRGLASEGRAVLLISSELPELLALSTRILVMRGGSIVGELPAGSSEEQVLRLMAGVN